MKDNGNTFYGLLFYNDVAGKIVMGIDYSYFLRNNLCMNMLAVERS